MLYYVKDRIIKYNGINGEVFSFLTDLKKITGRILGRIIGSDLFSYSTMNEIANSSAAMNTVINSSIAMNIIVNSASAIDIVVNSPVAMNMIASSPTTMDMIVNSATAVDKVINSATALYYICINNSQGKGLEKLAGNIAGTTTVSWESDAKWQTIYNTLDNAPNLFNKSYYYDCCDACTIDRQGDLITLVTECYTYITNDNRLSITPRYSGCYSHSYEPDWTTGKHIMWGGHSSKHAFTTDDVKHYMFTPIT